MGQAARDAANEPPATDAAKAAEDRTPPPASAPDVPVRLGPDGKPLSPEDAAYLKATEQPGGSSVDPKLQSILDRQKAGDPTAATDLSTYKEAQNQGGVLDNVKNFGKALVGSDDPDPLTAKGSAQHGLQLIGDELIDQGKGQVENIKNIGRLGSEVGSLAQTSDGREVIKEAWQENFMAKAAEQVPDLFAGLTTEELKGHAESAWNAVKGLFSDPDKFQEVSAKATANVITQVAMAKGMQALGDIPSLGGGGLEPPPGAPITEPVAPRPAAFEPAPPVETAPKPTTFEPTPEPVAGPKPADPVAALESAPSQAQPPAPAAEALKAEPATAQPIEEPPLAQAASEPTGKAPFGEPAPADPTEAPKPPTEEPQGRHDGETKVTNSDAARAERAGSDTVRDQVPESKPSPRSLNDGDLGDAPINDKEQWGTRLPPEHDPIAIDMNDPPVDPITGKPFEEGGLPDPHPSDPPTKAAGPAAPDDPNATTKVDTRNPLEGGKSPENYKGADADWRKAPVSDNEDWGTRKSYDPYKVDPNDPAIDPVTGEPVPEHQGTPLPGNEMPSKPRPEPQPGTPGTETADLKPQVSEPAPKPEPRPQPGTPGSETADLKPQDPGMPNSSRPPAGGETTKFENTDMPGDRPTGPRGTDVLDKSQLPEGGVDQGPAKPDAAATPPPADAKPDTPSPASEGKARFRAAQEQARAERVAAQGTPDAPPEHVRPYADEIQKLRDTYGRAGPCETTKELLQKSGFEGAYSEQTTVGQGDKAFNHEVVVTKEGNVIDPYARQAVERGLYNPEDLQRLGLTDAVEKGVFTPEQWRNFSSRPLPQRFR